MAGPLTCEDVWAMPDDGYRHELIDGALIVTPAPRLRHQRALTRFPVLLANACPPELEALPAPFDYKISEYTMLEPDIVDGTYVEAADVRGHDTYDATVPFAVRVVPADLVRTR